MSDLVYASCTEECERPATCTVCRRRKSPLGRSAPLEMANSLCDFECRGYRLGDSPPHLWPGELASIRQDEAEQAADKVADGEVGS